MSSSERRIAANHANAQKSTGQRTAAGKEVARGNALKYGLTALVVVPGEEQGAVAARVEWVQDDLAPEGDPLILILARQVAYLSVQTEPAFRYQTAMAAQRARNATAEFDELHRTAADQWFGYLGAEPLTHHRRLLSTTEGVDLLLGGRRSWAVSARREGRPGRTRTPPTSSCSRATYRHRPVLARVCPEQPDRARRRRRGPGGRPRRAGGLGAGRAIAAEVARLRAHRASLDPARHAVSRAQAPDRAVMGFDKEARLAHRYQFAALRALHRAVDQIRARRRDLTRLSPPGLTEAAVRAHTLPDLPAMPASLASFCALLDHPVAATDASRLTIGMPNITTGVSPSRPNLPPKAIPGRPIPPSHSAAAAAWTGGLPPGRGGGRAYDGGLASPRPPLALPQANRRWYLDFRRI